MTRLINVDELLKHHSDHEMISTKEGVHPLIIDFLSHWKQMIMYLNNEENRYLAEFRDALLPELMSGKIEVKE